MLHKLIPYLEEHGVKTIIVEPNSDYITEFMKVKTRGKNAGKILGFPVVLKNSCWANSRLKIAAINKAHKMIDGGCQIIGIAYDEKERAERLLNENKVSILYENGITEEQTKQICAKYDLLSPIYETSTRDGCWFCNQMSIAGSQYIDENYPELVSELERLENETKDRRVDYYTFARHYMSVRDFYSRRYKRKT